MLWISSSRARRAGHLYVTGISIFCFLATPSFYWTKCLSFFRKKISLENIPRGFIVFFGGNIPVLVSLPNCWFEGFMWLVKWLKEKSFLFIKKINLKGAYFQKWSMMIVEKIGLCELEIRLQLFMNFWSWWNFMKFHENIQLDILVIYTNTVRLKYNQRWKSILMATPTHRSKFWILCVWKKSRRRHNQVRKHLDYMRWLEGQG